MNVLQDWTYFDGGLMRSEDKGLVDRRRSLDRQKCHLGESTNQHNSGRGLSRCRLQKLPDVLEAAMGCQQDTG